MLTVVSMALPLAAAAKGTSLLIDRLQSRVDIAVNSTIDSFVARLEDFDAAITMNPDTGRVETGFFRANIAALKTGRADRDRDMNAWLQTDQFPQTIFELTALDPGPDAEFTARGRFQLHGQQRDISFSSKITYDRGVATIDGTAALDTRDYGLPVIKKFWVLTVDPVVHVRLHLEGRLTVQ
jgi:polyisoprenoid-binding protein YceI